MASTKNDEFDPSKLAPLKLWGHIMQKGWQAGSVIGSVGVGPGLVAYQMVAKKATFDALLLTQGASYGALAGFALTGVLGALKTLQIDREGIEDRVYRLHYNQSQNRNDLFAGVGGLVGVAAAAYLLPKYGKGLEVKPLNYVGGAALGTFAGILAHVLTRPKDHATPNKMLHELKY